MVATSQHLVSDKEKISIATLIEEKKNLMAIANDQKELIKEKDLKIACLENVRKDLIKAYQELHDDMVETKQRWLSQEEFKSNQIETLNEDKKNLKAIEIFLKEQIKEKDLKIACLENGRKDLIKANQTLKDGMIAAKKNLLPAKEKIIETLIEEKKNLMAIVNDQKEQIKEKDLKIASKRLRKASVITQLETEIACSLEDQQQSVISIPNPADSKPESPSRAINFNLTNPNDDVTGNLENHLDVSEVTSSESCFVPGKKFRSKGMNTLFDDAPLLDDESKRVIEKDVVGTIIWFSIKSGCGYIKRNNSQETLFVHRTSYRYLRPGELVTFDIAITVSGKKVLNLSILQGQDPFKGTPYAEDCGL